MGTGVHLLVYADRLGDDLRGIARLLGEGPLMVFSGVHLLPFFTPFDGDDAGFDPVDHASVDPRLGTWADVRALADGGLQVTADLIVNHVSTRSVEFQHWLAHGQASPWHGMFLTYDTVFPSGAGEAELTAFHRPRAGLPFTAHRFADGSRHLVWTTFMPTQVDLDVGHRVARDYLRGILRTLAGSGVRVVRLDAVGYAVKTAGTDSFMTPETFTFIEEIVATAHEEGLVVLVEVHAHHTQQMAIASVVDLVYDFALPPLLLHALGTGDLAPLQRWLDIRPRNVVTVLDTHDGIGIIDAGPSGERAGLLDHDQMASIFQRVALATGGESALASQNVAWADLPHQVNSTFFSALGCDPTSYLLARAVQLFLPGQPQIYYVGLLAGTNDIAALARTGQGREVNRHRYSDAEIDAALRAELPRAQLALVRLRTEHPAFAGEFSWTIARHRVLELSWSLDEHRVELSADVTPGSAGIDLRLSAPTGPLTLTSAADLIEWSQASTKEASP